MTAYTHERISAALTQILDEDADTFAHLIDAIEAFGRVAGASVEIHLPQILTREEMATMVCAIDAPGVRIEQGLARAVGHSGSATVSVLAEVR